MPGTVPYSITVGSLRSSLNTLIINYQLSTINNPVMKRSYLFLFLILLSIVHAWADELIYTENNVNYYLASNGYNAYVGKSPSASGDIIIRDKIPFEGYDYRVTNISDRAFYECSGITGVTLPNSVTRITDYAFGYCTGLTTINLPNSVTHIESAFFCCRNLKEVTFGNKISVIGGQAFEGCSSLTTLLIPKSVSSISSDAFDACDDLTSIIVEDGNSVYDSRNNCNAIIEKSTNSLIRGCRNTTIPEGVKSIGPHAFKQCGSLKALSIPNSVTYIGSSAFFRCSGLTSITVPNSVTKIDSDAFYYCTGLTSISIPNSVETIMYGAFMGCTGLTEVTIGSGVTSMGFEYDSTFKKCSNVTDVYCYADPSSLTWIHSESDFSTTTKFHVFNDSDYRTKFSSAIVSFVGDLAAKPKTVSCKGSYWATYYNSKVNLVADENTIVYKIVLTNNELTLAEISDRVINAGQGVLLKSSSPKISLSYSSKKSATRYNDNCLTGTDRELFSPDDVYVLNYDNGTLGFYKINDTETIGENKAYLIDVGTLNQDCFVLDESRITTEIDQKTSDCLPSKVVLYDIQGRRIKDLKRGLYIVNGRKVVR